MNNVYLKRSGLLILLVLLTLNNVYAQYKNNIFFNLGSPTTPVFNGGCLGVGYERAVNKHIALIGSGDFSLSLIAVADDPAYGIEKGLEIDMLAHFRYYPFGTASGKLFLDAGTGYTFLSMTTSETKTSNFVTLQAQSGWKFIIRRAFIQPWIGYNISFGNIHYPAWTERAELQELAKYGIVNFGLSVGFVF
jgi:hypothetical protein